MFNYTSRYYTLETVMLTTADGKEIAYKRRRFLPDPSTMQIVAEVVITQGDRLDLITAKALGDPEHFWRICDASNAMNPQELEVIGKRLKIPLIRGV